MANVLLQQHLDGHLILDHSCAIGVNLVSKFYACHLNIKAVKIKAMDTFHVRRSCKSRLKKWFEIAHQIFLTVPTHNIYNMDKTGLIMGHMRTAKHVVNTNAQIPH